MDNQLFIPSKVKVGYNERQDTYTKRLAYVIYYDKKGVLRKEASWKSWCDEKLGSNEYDNVPTEGFVLNKKAGGYSSGWNHRSTYCRVYEKRKAWDEAAKDLGVDMKFDWFGFSVEDWKSDLQTRINKIQITKKKAELEALESKLNLLISPEMRTQMEIDAISKELGI